MKSLRQLPFFEAALRQIFDCFVLALATTVLCLGIALVLTYLPWLWFALKFPASA